MKLSFKKGVIHGIPIALGYLSVSFALGITAIRSGLSVLSAVIISMTNLTSAGQAAGIAIIAASGGYIEMLLTQFIINLRYALMGIALSQKLDEKFSTPHRLASAFGITDEVFAVAVAQEEKIIPSYMYGMISISWLGWTLGTLLGAAAGNILPSIVTNALGIVLYGMFIAIIVPPSRKSFSVLMVVLIAAALSILFKFVFTSVSSGFTVIICAVSASVIGALFFPVKENEEEQTA